MPCVRRERWRKTTLYGSQRNRSGPQRVYCRDCMSRSGPNMKPPNSVATVTTMASVRLRVSPHATANVGAAKSNVMKSCVFPDGKVEGDYKQTKRTVCVLPAKGEQDA